jgi:hypothetical protein
MRRLERIDREALAALSSLAGVSITIKVET